MAGLHQRLGLAAEAVIVPWVIEPVMLCIVAHQQQAVLVALPGKVGAVGQSFVQEVSPVSLAGASLHCWFLFVVLAVAVITGWGRKYEGPNGEPVKALPAQTK